MNIGNSYEETVRGRFSGCGPLVVVVLSCGCFLFFVLLEQEGLVLADG